MDPMGGHCNNGPLANTGFLSYPTYPLPPPPPPPPPFDYMSPCHRTPDFWAGYPYGWARSPWSPSSNPYPDPGRPRHQPPVRGDQVAPCQIPAPPPSDVGSVVLAARLKEVSAAKTSSAALQGQHVRSLSSMPAWSA
ncbi:hypothetical protein EDB80DRAFT_691537 [Ilyonectria destructans]|nr:hypothetical protein EDB80DRAFT_691537 [Ilyonectria destructans]